MSSVIVASMSAAGTTFGGPVGYFVAQLAASYIDSTIVYPALFGADLPDPPKIADVSVTGANEGGPISMCIGPEVRVPLSIIWAKKDPIVIYNENASGKGGGGPTATTLSYYTHVTYAACRSPVALIDGFLKGIREVSKVWLDGKRIYVQNADVDLSIVQKAAGGVGCAWLPGRTYSHWDATSNEPVYYYWIEYRQLGIADDSADFGKLASGEDVVITGFADAVANVTKVVLGSEYDPSTGYLVLKVQGQEDIYDNYPGGSQGNDAVAYPDFPARFEQDRNSWSPDDADWVSVRRGTDVQSPHGWEENEEGEGDVPGYRGLATVSFNRLALAKFGNRIPTGHALVKSHETLTLGQAIRIIVLSYSDLTEDDIDTSTLEDVVFRGYAVSGNQSVAQILQPILLTYDILMVEIDNQLIFVKRTEAPVHAINANKLGARRSGGGYVTPVSVSDLTELRLPNRVIVNYIDPDNEWQPASTSERSPNAGTTSRSGEIVEINLSLTLTEQEARQLARRLLYDPVRSRRSLRVSVMPSEVSITEGSLLSFTTDGYEWLMLVDKLDRGDDFSYQAEGIAERAHLRSFPDTPTEFGGAYVNPSETDGPYVPPRLTTSVFNVPAMKASEALVPAMGTAVFAFETGAEWRGADLLRNNPAAGTTYNNIRSISQEAVGGVLISAMPAVTNWSVINHTAYVDVRLKQGDLSSVTFQEFLDGSNKAFIRNEAFSFRTATLLQGNDYRLTGLRRGLSGTSYEGLLGHEIGTPFFMNNSAVLRTEYPAGLIGQTRNYRVVPTGGDQTDYDVIPLRTNAINAKYWQQSNIRGQRVLSDTNSEDIVIKWDRVSRIRGTLFQDAPDFEGSQLYRIRIWRGTPWESFLSRDLTLVIGVGEQPQYLYTGFSQIHDDNTGTFYVTVNRVGDYGPGPANTALLPNL